MGNPPLPPSPMVIQLSHAGWLTPCVIRALVLPVPNQLGLPIKLA